MDQSDVVARALSYPYAVPSHSVALVEGGPVALAAAEVDRSDRIPLIAYGSNASPGVLARKLGAATADPVPLVLAALDDYDVVYSAHIAAYGSVPATLRHSPGTVAPVFVAYLTEGQLGLISETEPNYELRSMRVFCTLDSGEGLHEALAYVSRHGCLQLAGREVALDVVSARGRVFPEMSQRQALERLRDAFRPGQDLERFILDCVAGDVPDLTQLDRTEAP